MSRRDEEDAIAHKAEDEAMATWDRRQRAMKRRLALGMGVTLSVAFAGAALVGHSYRANDESGSARVAQHR
jgi:hypothetical protein